MAVRACVRVISEDVASLPLFVNRRLEPRGKERAPEYPLYSLLHDQPNPEMTALQWRETMTMQVLLTGNAFAEIIFANGRPAQLWPIPPSMVSARRGQNGLRDLDYYVTPPIGPSVRLPSERMFHLRGMSSDGLWGISPIADARETIGLGMAQEQFSSGFYANGARPSVVFEYPGALSEDAHKRLRTEIEGTLTGLTNAQRVAILEEGMKAHELQISPEDAQTIESRKFSVEEIARLYRVHPHKIAVMEGTQNFASVEQANIDHVVSTIRPWAVRWEQQIAKDLIPEDDRDVFYAEHELAGLLRGDAAGRANFYRTLWNIGVMSANDIRELENMNPAEGGDTYYVPVNTMPAGSTPAEQAQRARLMLVLGANGATPETREEQHALT